MLKAEELAHRLAEIGWFVFPCGHDKKPLCRWKEAATNNQDMIEATNWPGLVGVYCAKSNFFGIDLDIKNGNNGVETWQRWQSIYQGVEAGPKQRTPGGGQHLLFKLPANITVPNKAGLFPGIDLRSEGYICTGPGYEWLTPPETAIPDAPEWFINFIDPELEVSANLQTSSQIFEPSIEAMKTTALKIGGGAENLHQTADYWFEKYMPLAVLGKRNEVGFNLACQCRDSGLPQVETEGLPYPERCPQGKDIYSREEWMATVKSVYERTPREAAIIRRPKINIKHASPPADPPFQELLELTDLGNADRFIRQFGNKVSYSVKHGNWLLWDGKRWVLDERGEIYDLAGQAVKNILLEAHEAERKDDMEKLTKWAIRSQDKRQIENLLCLAKHKVAVLIDELDRDPYLLNCQNGKIDLLTGELLEHDPQDFITKVVNAKYNPNADCPFWTSFLNRIMGGNDEIIHFLQRAVGYSLTGATIEQCLFILHGNGANGKSTFLETLARLIGDGYAAGTPTETIMLKRFDGGIPNDLARLKGARFVNVNEVEQGRRMAESKVKQMTGGDTITARFMRGEYFDFIPEYKLWIRANHKPEITGTDNAIWRRIRLIPFEVEIPPKEQDPYLMEKLAFEYEGILAWAVEGCLQWQSERLNPPETVTKATAEYREEMDIVGHYLTDRAEVHSGSVLAKTLYLDYCNWCEENGDRPIKQRAFSRAITEKGFKSEHTNKGNVILNLGLITNA